MKRAQTSSFVKGNRPNKCNIFYYRNCRREDVILCCGPAEVTVIITYDNKSTRSQWNYVGYLLVENLPLDFITSHVCKCLILI